MGRWVKLWVNESLQGTIRFDLEPDERGVWYDLLVLAGQCQLDGIIAAGLGRPYPPNWLAGTLNISLELLERTLRKCEQSGKIEVDSYGIHILNWSKYQSEYDRQRPYRQKKKEETHEAKISKWRGNGT
ncbi:MAG: phage replisome organizer N-terminal domain-containing protein [Dehalococcoidales bacterium]